MYVKFINNQETPQEITLTQYQKFNPQEADSNLTFVEEDVEDIDIDIGIKRNESEE
jgi:hypothetical protein